MPLNNIDLKRLEDLYTRHQNSSAILLSPKELQAIIALIHQNESHLGSLHRDLSNIVHSSMFADLAELAEHNIHPDPLISEYIRQILNSLFLWNQKLQREAGYG